MITVPLKERQKEGKQEGRKVQIKSFVYEIFFFESFIEKLQISYIILINFIIEKKEVAEYRVTLDTA